MPALLLNRGNGFQIEQFYLLTFEAHLILWKFNPTIN